MDMTPMPQGSAERNAPPLRLAGLLWLLAGTVYLSSEAIAAAAFPEYSYAHNYISDLGVPYEGMINGRVLNSTRAFVMNIGGFIVDGTLFAAATVTGVCTVRAFGPAGIAFLVLGLVHSLGTVLVGLVHSGERELADGTHHIHMIGAAMAIIGGNAALLLASRLSNGFGAPPAYRITSAGLGLIGFFSLAMLEANRLTGTDFIPDGIWERASVYPITAWEIMTGLTLLILWRCREAGRAAG